jgi:hypothetical protein
MESKLKKFDRREWKRKLTTIFKENPELTILPNKIGVYSNGTDVCKVKVEDKEV